MIRKLRGGEYRLYSQKADAKTGKRRNLGTFPTREAAITTRTRSPVLQAALRVRGIARCTALSDPDGVALAFVAFESG
jgi:hypothetical protein